ncbi:MAG: aminotransferase class I/II-fold pyridoxal phosphate-dependent enzyme [Bacteroidetes bacterium]|nr:aminotransferase class I/II-fold pyridoxal phosphate-dependent enzyme [Bacteroidota bacterium]
MKTTNESSVGESANIRDMLLMGRRMKLRERMLAYGQFMEQLRSGGTDLLRREVLSAADRVVLVRDPNTGHTRSMLMFGSNNYLGLANHPHVLEAVRRAMLSHGAGLGGPPLLNGYTTLHRELEARLAALKGSEDALLFSSGYGANVGIATGLFQKQDVILFDSCSHASFVDGMSLAGPQRYPFRHNDMDDLAAQLRRHVEAPGDIYVAVEGVYSMDGDTAPLARIVSLCREHAAILLLDDAHGTGVLGAHGSGTAEACGVHGQIDLTMGTFSKAFGMAGGFLAASSALIDYLRVFARSYMFSASLPPIVVAAVLAGLDIVAAEPERRERLWSNIDYAVNSLNAVGIPVRTDSAILALRVPERMNIRHAATAFHERGLFVNSIEYPAVPLREQRFRISLMATHTHEDIDRLVEATAEIWSRFGSMQIGVAA